MSLKYEDGGSYSALDLAEAQFVKRTCETLDTWLKLGRNLFAALTPHVSPEEFDAFASDLRGDLWAGLGEEADEFIDRYTDAEEGITRSYADEHRLTGVQLGVGPHNVP